MRGLEYENLELKKYRTKGGYIIWNEKVAIKSDQNFRGSLYDNSHNTIPHSLTYKFIAVCSVLWLVVFYP